MTDESTPPTGPMPWDSPDDPDATRADTPAADAADPADADADATAPTTPVGPDATAIDGPGVAATLAYEAQPADLGPRVLGGRYQLGRVIGRGGMAVVSQARDLRLGRDVAVKELRLDLASDATFQARFRREAQASAGLNHPNIVSVYDTGEEEDPRSGVGVPYIVMELLEGRTLREVLREGRPILPRRALEFTQGVLDALSYSHRAGIVHRDIKPANVMLMSSGAIKVMDFGIARAVSDTSATMTQTAAVIGTAQYLSPEQARGETVDARSDIYSAGCLMYELLVGRPPFQGDSPVSVAYQHVREAPVPPSQLDAEITAPMDAVVLRALAKDPEDRYQTADEMRDDIGRILGGQRVHATLPPPVPPRVASAPVAAATATQVLPTGAEAAPSPVGADGTDSGEPPEEEPRKRRTLAWTMGIAVLVIAVVSLAVVLWPRTAPGPTMVSVPTGLVGQLQAAAEASVTAAGLTPAVSTENGPDNNTVGTVTRTDPTGGTQVESGSRVTLYVNIGPQKQQIPSGLEGLTYDAARQRLTDAGFTNVTSTKATSEDITAAPNVVTAVSPPAGQEIATGTLITLTVTTGESVVPDLRGMTPADAEAYARDVCGFTKVEVEKVQSTAANVGFVFQTRPGANTSLLRTSRLVLLVGEASTPSADPTVTTAPASGTPTP